MLFLNDLFMDKYLCYFFFYLLEQLVEAIKMLFYDRLGKEIDKQKNLEEEFLHNCLDFRND